MISNELIQDHLLPLAIGAAWEAGQLIEDEVLNPQNLNLKDGMNSLASSVVTEVDFKAQEIILKHLSHVSQEYHLGILTEESPDDGSRNKYDYFWAIDPLDGTLAFTRGLPGYSVAIALVSREGEAILGVTYSPHQKCCYYSSLDQGLYQLDYNQEPPLVHQLNCPKRCIQYEKELHFLFDKSYTSSEDFAFHWQKLETYFLSRGYHHLSFSDDAGAVIKAIQIIEGVMQVDQATDWVYFKEPKISLGGGAIWDFASTASHLREFGLYASQYNGAALNLNPETSVYMNQQGVFYSNQQNLLDEIKQALS